MEERKGRLKYQYRDPTRKWFSALRMAAAAAVDNGNEIP